MFSQRIWLFVLAMACSATALAQSPFKIGDVTLADFELYKQADDTSAVAVVLSEFGNGYFDASPGGLDVIFETTVRLHVLKKEGYDYADVEVPFYVGGSSSDNEYVSRVKAYSHNVVDGKVVTEKISKKEVFTEEYSENYKLEKFTIPNVKEGTIIEYTYRLTSPHFTSFKAWTFQRSIPVLRSEYKASIPEFFNYLKLFQGNKPFAHKETGTASFMVGSTSYTANTYLWVQENLPALKKEKYITTLNDYVVKMDFQLSSTQMPGYPSKDFMGTWPSMIDKYLDNGKFGGQLDSKRATKDLVESLVAGKETEEEKMAAIYEYVTSNISWNGKRRTFAEQTIKELLDSKEGTSAEINVLFVNMLRTASLDATPVLMSTRSHGRVNTYYPMIDKFNHIITYLKADGKDFLVSPLDAMRPYTMLDYEDLNGVGLLMMKENAPQWVNLNQKANTTSSTQMNLSLDEEGYLSGEVSLSQKGYDALRSRHRIDSKGEEEFVNKLLEEIAKNDGLLEYKFEGVEEYNENLKGTFSIETDAFSTVAGDRIYLNPMMGFAMESNPFTAEERSYPIDYGYSEREMFSFVLELPEGYEVEEMPETMRMALPNKMGSFFYTSNQIGNKLNINYRIMINAPVLEAGYYPYLKEFYAKIVEKQGEQVVLRKSATNE